MKLKNIVLFVMVLLLCGCGKVIEDNIPKDYYLNVKNNVVDVYSDSKLSNVINTNIKYEDVELNTDNIGDKVYSDR